MQKIKNSKLTKYQLKTFQRMINYNEKDCKIVVKIRYDDKCDNEYNIFSITGMIGEFDRCTGRYYAVLSGCIHEEIEKYFPEFKHLIKWHLCSSGEPMHYILNTKYWVSRKNIEYAKKSAIWGATKLDTNDNLKFLDNEIFLKSRLPLLLQAFKEDIKALEFTY